MKYNFSCTKMLTSHPVAFLACLTMVFALGRAGFTYLLQVGSAASFTAVTMDRNYLTVASSDGTLQHVTQIDVQAGTTTALLRDSPSNITAISEIKGYNNASTNIFLLVNSTLCSVYSNNFSTLVQSRVPNANFSGYDGKLGGSASYYLEMINGPSWARFNQGSLTNLSSIYNYTMPSQTGLKFEYDSNKVFMLTKPPSTTKLIIFNLTGASVIITVNLAVPDPTSTLLRTSMPYFAFSSLTSFQMYSTTANYLRIWNVTLTENILDFRLSSLWAFLVTNSTLFQYDILNGTQICNVTHGVASPRINSGEATGLTWVAVWSFMGGGMQVYSVVGGAASNLSSPTLIPISYGASPAGGGGGSPTNNPAQLLNNLTLEYCIAYNSQNQCTRFCPKSCQVCNENGTCQSCFDFHQPDMKGQCRLTSAAKTLIIVATTFNTVRFNSLQRIYFLIDDLKFHSYHNTTYTGTMASLLQFLNIFQQNLWRLLNVDQIADELDKPLPIHPYSSFTNPKFLQIQRSDSFFLQNTKPYFFLYIPISVLIFLLFNRLFYLVFKSKLSTALRLYSLSLSLIMMLVGQNITMIVFLACQHFKNMFSFQGNTKFMHGFTVGFIGVSFVLACLYFMACQYLYPRRCRVFLVNTYMVRGTFVLASFRFMVKPMIESIIHACMYENYEGQILCIAFINLLSFFYLNVFEMVKGAFKVKTEFLIDCLFDLSLSFLNFVLYIKQAAHPQASEQLQPLVTGIIYFIVFLMGFYIVFTLLLIYLAFIGLAKGKQAKKPNNQNEVKINTLLVQKPQKKPVQKATVFQTEIQQFS